MRIIFILEDMPDGEVDIKSIRMDLGETCNTPANRLAQTLDKKLAACLAKAKAEKCLH